jgi:CheY-like chemotaxis protein
LLQNLISNAVKYTRHGRVLIGCRRRDGRLRIYIYDTGIGIPASKTDAIFREFHRLEQGAQIARGLGLGLSIVERIARVLDHTIALNSVVGRGTHFSVEVPIAPALPSRTVHPPRRHGEPGRLAGMTVLCIDNDLAVLDGMQSLLAGWGCNVIKAADGKSAQQALLDHEIRPSVLLVDYHLDSGTGIDLVSELRCRLGDVPAILITADRSPEVRNAARAHNMQIVHKPVRPASLRALLAQ